MREVGNIRSKGLARTLGFVGGLLLILGSVFTFFLGVLFAAVHRSFLEGLGATALALEQFVIAILLLFFVVLAGSHRVDYRLAGGAVIVVVSLVGLILLGGGILVVIGFLLTLVAGILFIVPNA
ncbi:MAG: hypothetical protein L3K18_07165 [Thermoplasmata archaeon]|nr:hypothetical protein [Thermoplasmata archaeon]